MGIDQLEEMTIEQLQAMIAALREVLGPIQEKLTAIQKILDEREQEEHEWEKVLSHPKSQTFLKNLTEETKADIAAGRTKEWKTYRENLLHT
jgi:DnaJ-domain-containing protein 1